jgi:hypothetical protein
MAPWTLHDLRRTFSTGLARLRVPPHVKEMVLSHVSAKGPVEAIYDLYSYLPEQRRALRRWEAHLQSLVPDPAGIEASTAASSSSAAKSAAKELRLIAA